ncbi:hypothetical protein BV22DRAFT_152263 [Leucogyrophana mollusca]|uniref:Uncharacterized protein n=1 Tax=Leucogyrophana mollusca TaxID=85980 RepID=A0ACB8BTV4_9AGAM|nr:hypothetical protein BV22DRAFT_152263 [Leucogyrophana mollusca]
MHSRGTGGSRGPFTLLSLKPVLDSYPRRSSDRLPAHARAPGDTMLISLPPSRCNFDFGACAIYPPNYVRLTTRAVSIGLTQTHVKVSKHRRWLKSKAECSCYEKLRAPFSLSSVPGEPRTSIEKWPGTIAAEELAIWRGVLVDQLTPALTT